MEESFEQDYLGTQEVPGNPRNSGIAYVVLPKDVDRDKYILNCLNTHTVMIRGEQGDSFKKVFISKNIIDEIEFPVDTDTKGSPVIWIRLSMFNALVIVGVLKLQDKATDIFTENFWNKIRKSLDGYTSFSLDGNEPSCKINVVSNKEGKGKISISLSNPNDTAIFDLYVKGSIKLLCTKDFSIGSYDNFDFFIVDDKFNKKASLSYKINQGFIVYDEYNNKISTDENGIKIEDKNSNIFTLDSSGVLITPASGKKINVGGIGEPMILGNKLNTNLNNLISNIQKLITVLDTFALSEAAASAASPLTPMSVGFSTLSSNLVPITADLTTLSIDLINQLSSKSTAE